MDLITDLPPSNTFDSILTIIDQGCSKAAKFIPCNKTIDGQGVAKLYLQHLFPWFGIPKRIISDRDPRFTSNFSKAICKATNIQQNISSAFHPRTDGQTERINLWIENYLKEFVNGWQDNWSTLLPIVEFAHNSWKHEHTKYTPHQLILGINPSANLSIKEDTNPSAYQRLLTIQKARKDAQQSLSKCIKHYTPKRTLSPGDKVMLDSRNLRVNTPSRKLSVMILNPYPNFPLFFHHLFRVLGHSSLTRSLTRRSDRYQITWQVTWWTTWLIRSQLSHAITPQSAASWRVLIYPFLDCQLMMRHSAVASSWWSYT